jgi:hypothetical protein
MAALLSFITNVSGGRGGSHNGVAGLTEFLDGHLVKLDPRKHTSLRNAY